MHVDLLHPSRYMKSSEFRGKDVTYTIADVKLEELEREDNTKETKGILSFVEPGAKPFVLNRTNSDCLKAMFGVETNLWRGKRVTLFPLPMKDPFTKQDITGIRLRGSPDIAEAVSVTIKLRKRKPQTMTMRKTTPGAAPVLDGDELAAECAAIDVAIDGCEPGQCDALWTAGLGKRIAALPPTEKAEKTERFKARKRFKAETEAPPPA